ncbi:RagB/SusD family nutrient uptake outer membrane protein [Olivibacter domesticus]|uniref:SusD family protein n=1 Tax=Olivibacter domesticus TaxID=407022 RepID=A0A1H7V0U4_OLID1|nr:RagB/SusD family nutrient uptake outer membrane protein [Olivibacter domesticus]SEM02754.1 SusD family protein [Olivibacter domesticus]
MNKNIIYITSLFIALLVSCKKDLNTSPTDAVADSEIYKTADNIETVINGTWAYFNDTYFTFANPGYSAIMRTGDAMGSDVALTTKYGYRDAYAFTELFDRSTNRVKSFWTLLYKVIDNCNNVIAKVDAAEGDARKKAQLKGQAEALRAFCYLNLATYYQFSYQKDPQALAVPIYTEPTTVETEGKPKASLEEVYALITADLKDALVNLEGYSRPSAEKYKIDQSIVNGLLARTYLNMGEWALAAQSAQAARQGYELMAAVNYSDGFNDLQNSEWIWGHGQTTEQNTASYTFHFLDVSSSGSYYYSFMADPYFKELFDAQDIRSQLFEWDGQEGREGFLRYKKFKFKSNLIGDIVYMRSAEMYLIEAEGYARSGQTQQAIEALNALRNARKAVLFSGGSQEELVQAILVERRKELWGEGFSLSDILRTQGTVVRKAYVDANKNPIKVTVITPSGASKVVNGQGHRIVNLPDGSPFVANSKYYLFAIPLEEVQQNPNLQ